MVRSLFVRLFVAMRPENPYSAFCLAFFFYVFCRHTGSAPITVTAGTHTGGVH